jgi:hypothetical protein
MLPAFVPDLETVPFHLFLAVRELDAARKHSPLRSGYTFDVAKDADAIDAKEME